MHCDNGTTASLMPRVQAGGLALSGSQFCVVDAMLSLTTTAAGRDQPVGAVVGEPAAPAVRRRRGGRRPGAAAAGPPVLRQAEAGRDRARCPHRRHGWGWVRDPGWPPLHDAGCAPCRSNVPALTSFSIGNAGVHFRHRLRADHAAHIFSLSWIYVAQNLSTAVRRCTLGLMRPDML